MITTHGCRTPPHLYDHPQKAKRAQGQDNHILLIRHAQRQEVVKQPQKLSNNAKLRHCAAQNEPQIVLHSSLQTQDYRIFCSVNKTCFRTLGSYLTN